MHITQRFFHVSSQIMSKRCLRFLDHDITFKEAIDTIQRFSFFLQNTVQHRKNVGLFMDHAPCIFYSFFACANTLNAAVPLNPQNEDEWVAKSIRHFSIHDLLITENLKSRIQEIIRRERLSCTVHVVDSRRFTEFDTNFHLNPAVSYSESDHVLYLPTQGAMGPQQWVPFTHALLDSQHLCFKSAVRITGADTICVFRAHPLDSFAFLWAGIFPLLSGASVALVDEVKLVAFSEVIEKSHVTTLFLNPYHEREIHSAVEASQIYLKTVKKIIPIRGRMKAGNNYSVLRHYGALESGYLCAAQWENAPSDEAISKWDGHVISGIQMRFIDAFGDDLSVPVKEKDIRTGELVLSGPCVSASYAQTQTTRSRLTPFRGSSYFTGDVVALAREGRLRFLCPRSVAPMREDGSFCDIHLVTQSVEKLPGIHRAVFMEVENRTGKRAHILIVERGVGFTMSADDLKDYLYRIVPHHDVPHHVTYIQEVPLDQWGRPHYAVLVREFTGMF